MPLYLSPYTGKGTRENPFRPIGSDQPGWSAIDLRADGGQSLDGAGFPYALLWLAEGSVEDASLIKLADGSEERLAVTARQILGSKTILDLSGAVTITDALEELLLRPKENGWNPLSPVRGVYEAWLGSEVGKMRWVAKASRAIGGGAITDSFTRADETPVNAPWTAFPGTSGGQVNLTSGGLVKVTPTGDSFYYYKMPDGWGADQSCEMTEVTHVNQSDWGPAVRIGSNGFSAYFYSQYTGVASQRLNKCVAGTFSIVEAASGITTVGVAYKIEAIGSTLNYYDGGTADANSPGTDTALVSGGAGPGFQLFDLGGSLDLFTGTGEAASTVESLVMRFGFSPMRGPFKRSRTRPSSWGASIADQNLRPVIDEDDGQNRSRFGWSPSRRPQMRQRLRASRAGEIISGAGTLFFQSVDGTLTSSGALVKQTNKILAGTLTDSGALLKQASKILAGTLTEGGALVKQTNKILAGTLTDSGVLAAAKVALKTIQGTLTSSGSLVKQTNKILAGTLTSSGALLKQMNKILAGTLTNSGVLTTIKVVLKSIQGTLTSAGALVIRTNKTLAGSMASSGALTKLTAKTFAGTLTSSGVLASIRTVLKTIQGTLTSSGALIRRCGKGLTGTLTTAGLLGKQFKQTIAGTLTSAGTLIGTKSGFVLQALSVVATRGRVFVVKSKERTFSIATRVRTFVRRSRSREE